MYTAVSDILGALGQVFSWPFLSLPQLVVGVVEMPFRVLNDTIHRPMNGEW